MGTCYLELFGSEDRDEVRSKLGRFPEIRAVAWELYVRLYPADNRLYYITFDGCVFHVDTSRVGGTVSEFLYDYLYETRRIGGSGYCYKKWLREVGMTRSQINHNCRSLGAFPLVGDVLRVLLGRAKRNTMLTCCVQIGEILHVPEQGDRYTFHVMLMALRMYVYHRTRIGGDNVISIRSVDADVVQAMVRMSGRDPRSYFQEVIQQQLEKPNSEISAQLMSTVTHAITESLVAKNRVKLNIPYTLDTFSQGKIKTAFPEFDINFTNKCNHPHAMAASTRMCDENLVLYKARFTNSKKVPVGYDAAVKDVGGNLRAHLTRKRVNVHSCMPELDIRDCERATKTRIFMNEKAGEEPYRQMFRDEASLRLLTCQRVAQECVIRAPTMIFVHSLYDMTTTDVADAMDMSMAVNAYGALMFDVRIADETRVNGVVKDIGAYWERDPKAKTITFGFENDSSMCYTHKLSTYMGLLTTGVIISTAGRVYTVQQVDSRLGCKYIEITRCDSPVIPKSIMRFRIWNEYNADKLSVTYYEYRPGGYPKTLNINYKKIELVVPKRLVEAGKAFAFAQTQTKFSVNTIYEYMRSVNTRYVVNGVDVLAPEPVEVDVLFKLAHAIFLYAFNERYKHSMGVSEITDYIKNRRAYEAEGFFGRVWSFFGDTLQRLVAKIFFGHDPLKPITSEDKRAAGLIGRLYVWMERPDLFPIKIDDAVKFTEYTTAVNRVVTKYVVENFPVEYINGHQQLTDLVNIDLMESVIEASIKNFISPEPGVTATLETSEKIVGGARLTLENMYRDGACTVGLNLGSVPGDGDCLFHSWIAATGLKLSPKELRYELLRSTALNNLDTELMHEQVALLKSDGQAGWGDTTTVAILAKHYDTRVCLHYEHAETMTILKFAAETDLTVNKEVHLHYANSHFSPYTGCDATDFRTFLQTNGLRSGYADCIVGAQAPYWSDIYDHIWNNKLKKVGSAVVNLYKLNMYVSTAGYKLHEIVNGEQLLMAEPILDCCGSPGGFVDYLQKRGHTDVTSVSIDDKYKVTFQPTSKKIIADIRKWKPSRRYKTILADGAVETSYADEEIFRSEWALARVALDVGGDFVVKHNNYFKIDDATMREFRAAFKSVKLTKPLASKAGSSEVYIVCVGYMEAGDEFVDNARDVLISGLNTYYDAITTDTRPALTVDQLRAIYAPACVSEVDDGYDTDSEDAYWDRWAAQANAADARRRYFAQLRLPEIRKKMYEMQKAAAAERATSVDDDVKLLLGECVDLVSMHVDGDRGEDSGVADVTAISGENESELVHGGDVIGGSVDVDVAAVLSECVETVCIREDAADVDYCDDTDSQLERRYAEAVTEVVEASSDLNRELRRMTDSQLDTASCVYGEKVKELNEIVVLDEAMETLMCELSDARRSEAARNPDAVVVDDTGDMYDVKLSGCGQYHTVITNDVTRTRVSKADKEVMHWVLCDFFNDHDYANYIQGFHYIAALGLRYEFSIDSVLMGMLRPFAVTPDFDVAINYAKASVDIIREFEPDCAALLADFPWYNVIIGSVTCAFADVFYLSPDARPLVDFMLNNPARDLITLIAAFVLVLYKYERKMRNECDFGMACTRWREIMQFREFWQCVERIQLEYGKPKPEPKGVRSIVADVGRRFTNAVKAVNKKKRKPPTVIEKLKGPDALAYDARRDTVLGAVREIRHEGRFIDDVYVQDVKTRELLGCVISKTKLVKPAPDRIDNIIIARRMIPKMPLVNPMMDSRDNVYTKTPLKPKVQVFPADVEVFESLPVAGFSNTTTPLLRFVTDYTGQVAVKVYIYDPSNILPEEHRLMGVAFGVDIDQFMDEREASGTLSAGMFAMIRHNDNFGMVMRVSRTDAVVRIFDLLSILPTLHPHPAIFVVPDPTRFTNMSYVQLEEVFAQHKSVAYQHRWVVLAIDGTDRRYYDELNAFFQREVKTTVYKDQRMYEAWRRGGNNYTDYNPKRRPDFEPVDVARNAMDEIREYWRVKEGIVMGTCKEYFSKLKSVLTQQDKQLISESPEGYGLIDARTKKWVVKPNFEKTYQVVFDGQAFIKFHDFKTNKIIPAASVVLVSAAMELMQDSNLYKAVKNVDVEAFRGVEIENRQGVPGCGKTYNFLQTCVIPTKETMGDLVVFPTREACQDFREKIKNKHGDDLDDEYVKRNYRTLDSYLLNAGPEQYVRLMVDEALMVHVGQILFCAIKAGVTKVITIGDSRQIPFINRVPQVAIMYESPKNLVSRVIHLNVSYRCTLTTAALLAKSYEKGMKSVNKVFNEFTYERFTSIGAMVKDVSAQYLVFTQTEKNEMLLHGYKDVMTVHEYQGKQADHIVLVRANMKKVQIYKSEPHALVAISRHKKTFKYVSPVLDDAVGKYVEAARYLRTYAQLQQYHEIKIKGGGRVKEFVVHEIKGVKVKHPNVESCVGDYGYPDVPTVVASDIAYREKLTRYVPCVPVGVADDCHLLQDFIDRTLPGVSTWDYSNDSTQVLMGDIEMRLENTTFNPLYKYQPKSVTFDRMRPVLRTGVPKSRPNNQIEGLLSMIKRNQAVTSLAQVVDDDDLATMMLDRFLDYLEPEAREVAAVYRQNPLRPNTVSISNWLSTQVTGTVEKIEQKGHVSTRSLNRYKYQIKPQVKAQLDVNAPYTYNALQTIAYHEKDVNAIFCPIFRDLKTRVVNLLKDKFMINIDMSHDEFEQAMYQKLGTSRLFGKCRLEVDMSKYDKSQGVVMLKFETRLMRYFGVDEELIRLWYNAHVNTTLVDRNNKVTSKVKYQRKSGDASTFIGNTFYLMGVLATLFDVNDLAFACFGGDDSLMVGDDQLLDDLSGVCASMFNLESKFFKDYKYSYFCSKFLLMSEHDYKFVPDPVKLVTKLGRMDLVNPIHVEEYRTSLVDLIKPYENAAIHQRLSMAVCDRYGVDGDFSLYFSALYNIINNKALFEKLFTINPGDNINYDPSRPNILK